MKHIIFIVGATLLLLSAFAHPIVRVSNETLALFGLLILVSFFDDLQEFNFFGLRGRRVDKRLASLKEDLKKTTGEDVTNLPDDDLTKLKKKKVTLMGVDRGNFLALVFEIERLLRGIAAQLNTDGIQESTGINRVTEHLHENGYLTTTGLQQWKALSEVRNLIVQGRLSIEEDDTLSDWIELAYGLYSRIYDDIASVGMTRPHKRITSKPKTKKKR